MEFTLETLFVVFWLFPSISQMVSQVLNVFPKVLINKRSTKRKHKCASILGECPMLEKSW
jgi:hypothetical protein